MAQVKGGSEAGASEQGGEVTSGVRVSASAELLSGLRLGWKWRAASFWLTAVLTSGFVVAITLVALGPYLTLTLNAAVARQVVLSDDPYAQGWAVHDVDLTSGISRNVEFAALADPRSATATTVVAQLARQYISGFTAASPTYYVVGVKGTLARVDGKPVNVCPLVQAAFEGWDFASAAPHMRFLMGGPPSSGAQPDVVITEQLAGYLSLHVGDSLTFRFLGNQSAQVVRIAGIWIGPASGDPYWNGQNFNVLNFAQSCAPQDASVYPIMLTLPALQRLVVPPATPATAVIAPVGEHWIYYTQVNRIGPSAIPSILTALTSLQNAIAAKYTPCSWNSQCTSYGTGGSPTDVQQLDASTRLNQDLAAAEQQIRLLAFPLDSAAVPVVLLALLFIGLAATVLIEHQSQTIADLRSRGMSVAQLLMHFVSQGLVLAVVAALAAGVVVIALTLLLAYVYIEHQPLPNPTQALSYLDTVASARDLLVPLLVGAALSAASVALAAVWASRLDVVAYRRRQGRALGRPLWQRLNLDLLLVVLCVAGYYELSQFGASTTPLAFGSSTDLLAIVTPSLLLLAGALVVLRLVPLGARLGRWIAARGRGSTSLLALSQIERAPGSYARMLLLLMLAIALATYGLSLGASTSVNVRAHAAYAVGTDIRTTEIGGVQAPEAQYIAREMQRLPGAMAAMPVARRQVQTAPALGSQSMDLLAVDPAQCAAVIGAVAWRSDYAAESLATLMAQLRQHQQGTQAGAQTTPLWALISQTTADDLHLGPGDRFEIAFSPGAPLVALQVGAIVQDFPTLYPGAREAGFVVISVGDYLSTGMVPYLEGELGGANEYWLHTSSGAQSQVLSALNGRATEFNIVQVTTLAQALTADENSAAQVGMQVIMLLGALASLALALLLYLAQAVVLARQRTVQFAVLRSLGLRSGQMSGMLLAEQTIVLVLALVAGTVLGLLTINATLPYLVFSGTAVDPATLAVPPYVLVVNPSGMVALGGTILVVFALGLAGLASYARRLGIGRTLRLGDD